MSPRSRRRWAVRLLVIATAALAASCTVLNSLDKYQAGLGDGPAGPGRDSGGEGSPDGGGAKDGSGPERLPDGALAPRCDPQKPFGTPIAIDELNTAAEDMISDVSDDELTIYLGSNRNGPGVRLFYATRDTPDSTWGAPQALFPNDGGFDDWSATVAPRGLTAVIASSRGSTSIDLYVATRTSTFQAFGDPAPATATNSTANEQSPHWTPDGTSLYFDSERGGSRLMYRSKVQGSTLGPAEPVAELNDIGTFNGVPVLSKDELTIYFASNRPPTTDEGDIYVATRKKKGDPFGEIKRVDNVYFDGAVDAPGHITEDGCRLYMGSFRSGNFDIYVAKRPL